MIYIEYIYNDIHIMIYIERNVINTTDCYNKVPFNQYHTNLSIYNSINITTTISDTTIHKPHQNNNNNNNNNNIYINIFHVDKNITYVNSIRSCMETPLYR